MAWINGQWVDEDELQGMLYQNPLSFSPSMLGSITPTVGGYDRGPDAGWGLSRFPNLFTGLDTIVGDQNITPGYNPVADASIINESIQSSPYDPVALNKALSKPSFTESLNELNQQATDTNVQNMMAGGEYGGGGWYNDADHLGNVFSVHNRNKFDLGHLNPYGMGGPLPLDLPSVGLGLPLGLTAAATAAGIAALPVGSEGTDPDYSQMAQDWGDPAMMSASTDSVAEVPVDETPTNWFNELAKRAGVFGGTDTPLGSVSSAIFGDIGAHKDRSQAIEDMANLGLMTGIEADSLKGWDLQKTIDDTGMPHTAALFTPLMVPGQIYDELSDAGVTLDTPVMDALKTGYKGLKSGVVNVAGVVPDRLTAFADMLYGGDLSPESLPEMLSKVDEFAAIPGGPAVPSRPEIAPATPAIGKARRTMKSAQENIAKVDSGAAQREEARMRELAEQQALNTRLAQEATARQAAIAAEQSRVAQARRAAEIIQQQQADKTAADQTARVRQEVFDMLMSGRDRGEPSARDIDAAIQSMGNEFGGLLSLPGGSQRDFQGGLETGTGAYGFDPNY